MQGRKVLIVASLVIGVLIAGCVKKGVDPDAYDASGRSLACIEESMATYSMYEKNPKLAALDSTLDCKKLYNEDARKYTREHGEDFASIEKKIAAIKYVMPENKDDDTKKSSLKDENLFGFYGLKKEAANKAKNETSDYKNMQAEFKDLYKSYIACLDYNLAINQGLTYSNATDTQKTQIINQCIPVVDRYFLAQGPTTDSEGKPSSRAENIAERRSMLRAHSMQYLDGKLKFSKR